MEKDLVETVEKELELFNIQSQNPMLAKSLSVEDQFSTITTVSFSKCLYPKTNQKVITNLFKIFFDKDMKNIIFNFLPDHSKIKLKYIINKKFNMKEKKKAIKERLKFYLLDFGKNNEFVKYRITEENKLFMTTNIFNLSNGLIKALIKVFYNDEILELDKKDLYQFLKLLNKPQFTLIYKTIKLRLCRSLIPYDVEKNEENIDEYGMIKEDEIDEDGDFDNSKKYQLYYKDGINIEKDDIKDSSVKIDKDFLIEKQKNLLEKMQKKEKSELFYPLIFIHSVCNWTIILCQGGYFACGFFQRDKLIEHKSDHKYVVRKKAGQRQIAKDGKKSVKNSIGSQIRRENEKKHQENIQCILKLNDELLAKSDVIYLYAPGLNKGILIGNNEKSLFAYKKKIISIPFHVSRANYSNMMEIYQKLTTVVLEEENFNF